MDYATKQKKKRQDAIRAFFTNETHAKQEDSLKLGCYALLACIFNTKLSPDESMKMMGVTF